MADFSKSVLNFPIENIEDKTILSLAMLPILLRSIATSSILALSKIPSLFDRLFNYIIET